MVSVFFAPLPVFGQEKQAEDSNPQHPATEQKGDGSGKDDKLNKTDGSDPDEQDEHMDHSGHMMMTGHQMMMLNTVTGGPFRTMQAIGSGTSIQPASTNVPMWHFMPGGWSIMLHMNLTV